MLETEAFSYSKPLGIQIGSNNRGPCLLRQHTQDDADGALSDGQDGLARLQAQGFDPFHAGVDRLYKASLLKGDCFGDLHRSLVDNPIHDANIFREASAGRLEAGSASDFLVGRTLGERLMPAVVTLATGDVMKHHDPVARRELAHARAYRRHYAGGFVAEDAGSRVGAGGNFF